MNNKNAVIKTFSDLVEITLFDENGSKIMNVSLPRERVEFTPIIEINNNLGSELLDHDLSGLPIYKFSAKIFGSDK